MEPCVLALSKKRLNLSHKKTLSYSEQGFLFEIVFYLEWAVRKARTSE